MTIKYYSFRDFENRLFNWSGLSARAVSAVTGRILQRACDLFPNLNFPWTPHATLILDEPDTICRALPVAVKNFKPFVGTVTRLHLCAFWPTREIVSIELKGNKKNN